MNPWKIPPTRWPLKLCLWLITVVSLVVPRRLRGGWRAEWEAELWHRWSVLRAWRRINCKTGLDLLRRSTGALCDALWLRRQHIEEDLWQDFRIGARMLLRAPAFTFVAVAVLSLGFGAMGAISSVFDAVVLSPLPYKDSNRLVAVSGNLCRPGLEEVGTSAPELTDYMRRSTVFEQMAAHATRGFNLTEQGGPEHVRGAVVTAELIPLLGARPLYGRTFLPGEDAPGREQVVIISYSLWQRRFGSDPWAVGRPVTIDGAEATVVGIMPAWFRFPDGRAELWKPLALSAELLGEGNRGSHFLNVIGRLKNGVTLQTARAEMAALASSIRQEHGDIYQSGFGVNVTPLHERAVASVRPALLLLLSAVAVGLIITCSNVSCLLLARARVRRTEIAIRAVHGATPARMVRQLLTESVLLSSAAGAVGLLVALWGVHLLSPYFPPEIPQASAVGLGGRAAALTITISLAAGMLLGLPAALQSAKADVVEPLKEGGRIHLPRLRRRPLRWLLVVPQVALSLVLLIGAGLMVRSIIHLRGAATGFDAKNVLTMRLGLPPSKTADLEEQRAFFQRLIARLESRPEVVSVGAINNLPFSGTDGRRSFLAEGAGVTAGGVPPEEKLRFISPGYFGTMRIPVVAGRDFSEADVTESPRVAIVNQALARKYWPHGTAIGKRLAYGWFPDDVQWYEIVGVVGDVKQSRLDEGEDPEVYLTYLQPLLTNSGMGAMFLVVRTSSAPRALVSSIRGEVLAVDEEQPASDVKTMEERLSESIVTRRLNVILLSGFAAAALVLAAVSIYGVMAHTLAERARELGIRIALGAQPRDLIRPAVRQGMFLTLNGILAGLTAVASVIRVVPTGLYGLHPADPLTFAVSPLLTAGVAFLSCYISARNAVVELSLATRHE